MALWESQKDVIRDLLTDRFEPDREGFQGLLEMLLDIAEPQELANYLEGIVRDASKDPDRRIEVARYNRVIKTLRRRH